MLGINKKKLSVLELIESGFRVRRRLFQRRLQLVLHRGLGWRHFIFGNNRNEFSEVRPQEFFPKEIAGTQKLCEPPHSFRFTEKGQSLVWNVFFPDFNDPVEELIEVEHGLG